MCFRRWVPATIWLLWIVFPIKRYQAQLRRQIQITLWSFTKRLVSTRILVAMVCTSCWRCSFSYRVAIPTVHIHDPDVCLMVRLSHLFLKIFDMIFQFFKIIALRYYVQHYTLYGDKPRSWFNFSMCQIIFFFFFFFFCSLTLGRIHYFQMTV